MKRKQTLVVVAGVIAFLAVCGFVMSEAKAQSGRNSFTCYRRGT